MLVGEVIIADEYDPETFLGLCPSHDAYSVRAGFSRVGALDSTSTSN